MLATLQAVPVADVRDGDQHLAQLAERDDAVHAVVVGDAADGAERRLAALPDGGALLGALADAHRLGCERLGDLGDDGQQVGDLLVGALDLDDQQRLDLQRIAGLGEGLADVDRRRSMNSMATGMMPAPMMAETHWPAASLESKPSSIGPRALGRAQDAHGRLGDDAELALRADHQAQQS